VLLEMSAEEFSQQEVARSKKYETMAVLMIVVGFLLLLMGLPMYAWGSTYGGNPYQIEGQVFCIVGFVILTVGLFFSLEYKRRN
jgi:hypothetical protein